MQAATGIHCGHHFCVAEHRGPLTKPQVCGGDDAGALMEFAEQMEEQGAAGRAKRQAAEFIQDHRSQRAPTQ
jgi:hypothetical protein